MKMDNKMVFVFLLFMVAIIHNVNSLSTANADDENRIESTDQLTVVIGDDQHTAESAEDPQQQHVKLTAAATTTETTAKAGGGDHRSGRQLYQPSFAAFQPVFPQRRAYRITKKKPPRTKSGRRPRPNRRRPSGPQPGSAGRFRRLPGPVRAQQMNYIDSGPPASVDYYDDADDFESGPPHQQQQQQPMIAMADYVEQRELDREPTYAVMPSAPLTTGRARKRPTIGGYADEPQVVHVPVLRVVRPTVVPTSTATAAVIVDPMEKLRQLVHEAMDEHFANRHQDLYTADGTFDNKQQRQHVFSAKYKRQPTPDKTTDKDKATPTDAVRSTAGTAPAKSGKDRLQFVSYATQPPQPSSEADVDADGSDDRLTLAEISAYMGAKPAETVLSAGGHRYVLSDALQQSYRYNRQQQQQQEQQLQYNGDDLHHQYLRYVSPFEAMYELPAAARWAFR